MTYLISFEHICQKNPLVAEFLSFIAYVDLKDIPQLFLLPAHSWKKEMDTIRTLDAYWFIIKYSIDKLVLSQINNSN
jgi:hypothetical protein